MEVKDTLIRIGSEVLDCHKDIAELSMLCANACKEIYKYSRRHYRFLLGAGIIYILVAEGKRLEQDKKIDTLVKEVEELKEMKGD